MTMTDLYQTTAAAAADILEQAAETLETDGWCQGQFRNSIGARCAIGALQARRAEYSDAASYVLARRAIIHYLGISMTSLVGWNDAEGRKAEEVIDAMRHAAKDLRNEVKPE